MKTPGLFVLGAVLGALAVFAIRAVSLEEPDPGGGRHEEDAVVPKTPPAPEPHGAAEPREIVDVRLDPSGQIASAHLLRGEEHVVLAAGADATSGDRPARVEGREGTFRAHVHVHSAHRLELTVMTEEGDLVARRMYEHGAEPMPPADEAGTPTNLICPVMGNKVDPDVFVDYEGRRIWFCCPPCIEKFLADPAPYLEKVDAELAARERDG